MDGIGLAFKLIGYSNSDLSDAALPLAVIIKSKVDGESRLSVYAANEVVAGEITRLPTFGSMIQSFLEDVRRCPAGARSELLFSHLSDLGVGPIRLVAQSASEGENFEDEVSRTVEKTWREFLWPESFVRL